MRWFLWMMVIGAPMVTLADPGVDVEATTDTVMKIKYSGGSPTGNAPVVSVEGKKIGTLSRASSTTDARGVVGVVGSSTLPTGTGDVGVLGVAGTGVWGQGQNGVWGVTGGYGYGVWGDGGGYLGVGGVGNLSGVQGFSYADWGYGVYGYADDWDNGYAGYFDGNLYVEGDVIEGSDMMLKKNVRPLDQGLGIILQLKPKAYEMKPNRTNGKTNPGTKFGLIAQDVQALVPEIVRDVKSPPQKDARGIPLKDGGDRTEFKAVNYTALVPVLIKAMQEQQEQIEAMKAEIENFRRN